MDVCDARSGARAAAVQAAGLSCAIHRHRFTLGRRFRGVLELAALFEDASSNARL